MTDEDIDIVLKYRHNVPGEEYIVRLFEADKVHIAFDETRLLYTERSVETIRAKRNMS